MIEYIFIKEIGYIITIWNLKMYTFIDIMEYIYTSIYEKTKFKRISTEKWINVLHRVYTITITLLWFKD